MFPHRKGNFSGLPDLKKMEMFKINIIIMALWFLISIAIFAD